MDSQGYKAYSIQEFNRAAEQFDNDDPSIYNMCRKDYAEIVAEIEKETFQDVLDAGCGTGAILLLLQERYPDKRYTGIDLSSKMIAVARHKKKKGMEFIEGDCEALPFKGRSFDVVICSMSFHHYPNPEKFFENVFRVLRPGGRLILRDMTGPVWMLWLVNYVELPLVNRLLHKGDVHAYSRKEIQRLCDDSGLVLENFEHRKGLRLHCICRKQP